MGTPLRILTFNFHEPYLCLMAQTGLRFFVGQYGSPPLARPWQSHYRPIPPNITLLDEAEWQTELMAGRFDVAIAHNETNALNIFPAPCPKILVCHNRKTFLKTTVTVHRGDALLQFNRALAKLQERFEFVFISESKRDDYGIPGRVILPGIDVETYGGYTGDTAEVLRVGNMMRERNLMFDVDFQERACRGLANRVVGDNPTIPGANSAASFSELRNTFRQLRCLLHVSREEYEDGYNLSMLEAMATGMPVVALANPSSPITDGEDGFLSYDAEVLHARLADLLRDLDLARAVGERGRETVARKFSIDAFTAKWREVIETAAEKGGRAWRPRPVSATDRRSILAHYAASPLTTGRYIDRALRKRHRVVAAGFRVPEPVLEGWGFTGPPPAYSPHEIDLPLEHTFADIVNALPEGFKPDIYLWIDSGPKQVPHDLDYPGMLKAGYLIDTHVGLEYRIEMARHFDVTFLAQKAQVDAFREAGIRNVHWMPLACSPELHDVGHFERTYDVAFISNPRSDPNDRRTRMMAALEARFPNSRIGQFWPAEMARLYAQSKIVVNASVNQDVNMRVFEALGSGALLITDAAAGLEDLFEDGTHLVIYRRDEDLIPLVERYLADEATRWQIASAGRDLVLREHTYDRRVEEMLHIASQGSRGGPSPFDRHRFTQRELMDNVPRGADAVLHVRCGNGHLGARVKQRGARNVIGVEADAKAAAQARVELDRVIECSLDGLLLPFGDGHFDCVLCLDAIEDVRSPGALLRECARLTATDGVVLVSFPNARYFEFLDRTVNGASSFEDVSIVEKEHSRCFLREIVETMIREAGLEILEIGPLRMAPRHRLPRDEGGSIRLARMTLGPLSDAEHDDLLTYQYLIAAGKPGGNRLAKARRFLEARKDQAAYLVASDAYGVDEAARRNIMATALARLGDVAAAEHLFAEALAIRPNDAAVTGNLGLLYLAANRHADARPLLETALAKDPGNSRVRGGLGLIALSDGRLDEAYTYLLQAMDQDFQNHSLLPHLVAIARELGRTRDIEPLVRRFADFYLGNADIVSTYAALLRDTDRAAEARQRLESFLVLDPRNEQAKALLDDLA